MPTHTRIRKFNTREAYPEQKLDNDLCMAVRAGNMVWLRGQTAMSLEGKVVGIGDAAAQTENAMSCVKTLLEEAGAKLEHIVQRLSRAGLSGYRQVAEGRLPRFDRPDRRRSRQAGIPDGNRRHCRDPRRRRMRPI
jgi:hypothetical protein